MTIDGEQVLCTFEGQVISLYGLLTIRGKNVIRSGLDILLPDNYVDVAHYESIYSTANCFRVFLASNRNRDQEILKRIATVRGVAIEDSEARKLCHEISEQHFGTKNVHILNSSQRIQLAQELRRKWHINARQIASLVQLKYTEVCKYI